MREWTNRMSDTHYVLGSVMGAHPFPMIVRDFQSIISREAREQILEAEGKLPTAVMACVGGGSNAMGMFYHFIPDEGVASLAVKQLVVVLIQRNMQQQLQKVLWGSSMV